VSIYLLCGAECTASSREGMKNLRAAWNRSIRKTGVGTAPICAPMATHPGDSKFVQQTWEICCRQGSSCSSFPIISGQQCCPDRADFGRLPRWTLPSRLHLIKEWRTLLANRTNVHCLVSRSFYIATKRNKSKSTFYFPFDSSCFSKTADSEP
jgi:hypothetical protein